MKKILLLLMLIISAFKGPSQYRWMENRDSLKYLINTTDIDTLKILWLDNLIVLDTYNMPDSALKYAQEKLSLLTNAHKVVDLADMYYQLAEIYSVLGNFPRALYYAFEQKRILDTQKDSLASLFLVTELSDIYYAMGDFKSAYRYMNDSQRMMSSLPESFTYRNKIINTSDDMMYRYTSRASIFLLGKVYDSALYYAKKAFKIDRQLGRYWSQTPLVLGNVYLALNEIDLALIYYREQVKIPALKDQVNANIGISSVFKIKRQTDSAIYFAKKAIDTSRVMPYLNGIIKASALLANLYEGTDTKEALNYYKINSDAKDSLYSREKSNAISNVIFNEERKAFEVARAKKEYENTIRLVATLSLAGLFAIGLFFMYKNIVNKNKAYKSLTEQKEEVDLQKKHAETALIQLRSAQAQLIQSEKMASLGELTAGIAHEIQNPLNFVNNFSDVSRELVDEMTEELEKGDVEQAKLIGYDIKQNLEKIHHHGRRADSIVKGMLQHSRASSGKKDLTDINALTDEYFRLSYHGMRAKDKNFSATMQTDLDSNLEKIYVMPQDIGRVLLNIFNNAFYAVTEKKKQSASGYEPIVSVATRQQNRNILVSVKDNGNGIPTQLVDKIFQPFFTTKPTGQGTGLGLSISYDIIKAHGGELKAHSEEGKGTEFIIQLPMA